jgi:hypothetical protein
MSKPESFPPPDQLSPSSEALWVQVAGRRAKSPGRLALVEQALRARDRAEEFRALLATQDLVTVTTTTGAVHVNPAVRSEREARQLFAKIWTALHLEWDAELDSR